MKDTSQKKNPHYLHRVKKPVPKATVETDGASISYLERTEMLFKKISSVIGLFLIMIIVGGVLWYAVKKISSKSIIIAPFEVPTKVSSEGLSGEYFAERVANEMEKIKSNARVSGFVLRESRSHIFNNLLDIYPIQSQGLQEIIQVETSEESNLDIEVEATGAGISLGSMIRMFRELLKYNPPKSPAG